MTRRQSVSLALVFLVLGMLASALLGNARFLNEAGERARLDDLVSGEAARPFVSRRMVPVMVGVIDKAAPETVNRKIREVVVAFNQNEFAIKPFQRTMHAEELEANGQLYLYLMLVNGVLLGVFGYFLARTFSLFYETSVANGVWIGVSALGAYSFFSPFTSYFPYDQATLALMAMGVYGSVSGSRQWFWVAVILGPWNRVTAVFLPVIDVVMNWKQEQRGRQLLVAGIAVFYCLVVNKALELLYADTPGQNVARKWKENWGYLQSFGEPTYFPFWLMLAFFAWFHWKAWTFLPERLRRVIPWVYIPTFVLHYFFGVLREFRAFVELYPLFWLVGGVLVLRYLSFVAGEERELESV